MIQSLINFGRRVTICAVSLTVLTGCSFIEEDTSDCPEGLYVRFVYDFNTVQANGRHADLFNDHVGHVQLYVYDEDGKLVASRSVSNSENFSPLTDHTFTMHFGADEVPPGHSYRLQAIAMNKDWDEALATDGAKYRITSSPADHENNLIVSLDHATPSGDEDAYHAVSDDAPLDIFWHTLKVTAHEPIDGREMLPSDRTVSPYYVHPSSGDRAKVEAGKATYATVSLIRDTKHLTIGLHQVDADKRKDLTADKFEVSIVDANCCVDHANTVNTHHNLLYTPYASWTVRLDNDGTTSVETVHKGDLGAYGTGNGTRADEEDTVVERQAHYNMMFNRLMLNDDTETSAATLQIKNKETGTVVADINLPHYLSMGRDAYALSNYSHQEYLDREYDYHLDFFLQGNHWIAIEIHVLSWSKRVQNVEL